VFRRTAETRHEQTPKRSEDVLKVKPVTGAANRQRRVVERANVGMSPVGCQSRRMSAWAPWADKARNTAQLKS